MDAQLTLEVISEAEMPIDVDRAVRQLLCHCFPPDVNVFSHTRAWHGTKPAFSVVCRTGLIKIEPTALAAGDEHPPIQPIRPEASAYGSQESTFSSAHGPTGPMKSEPTALAAGDEHPPIQPIGPEASAYGSQNRAFSSADGRTGDAVLGQVGIVIREVQCGTERITVAGVQNLCVTLDQRGSGLSQRLMDRAMNEAVLRHVGFGLLFCVPGLERFYRSIGWSRAHSPVIMLDEQGRPGPLPAKNITMVIELANDSYPPGTINLLGPDW